MTIEELKEFDADISKLPAEEQTDLRNRFYYQKVLPSPEWQQLAPEVQQKFAAAFKVPTISGQEAPGILERIRGEYHDPRTLNPFTHLGNAATALGTPGRAIKEAMMTPYYDMRGKQRPIRDPSEKGLLEPGGLASQIPNSLGEWAETVAGPKVAGWALGLARHPLLAVNAIRRLDQNIRSNYAGAAGEAMGWQHPAQKALPANAGPGLPRPMPGRVYSPFEIQEMQKAALPQHAPRPPQLMPKKARGDDLIQGYDGGVWQP